MIVKIQRSINTSLPVPQVLVYNEDRTVEWFGALLKDIEKLMGRRLKVFAEARLVQTELVIDKLTADQDW